MTSPTIPMLIGMTQGTEGSVVQNPPVNVGDRGSIPGLGRFPWRRKWQPNPVFCLKIPWTEESTHNTHRHIHLLSMKRQCGTLTTGG